MTAALITAIRDLSDIYKKMSDCKSIVDPKLQLQASMLENQVVMELEKIPVKESQKLSSKEPLLATNHRPLVSSLSAVGSIFGGSSFSSDHFQKMDHRRLDRSFSEPFEKASSNHQPSRNNQSGGRLILAANSSRYKTELCRPFEENGTCKYGEKCQFAHGIQELRILARHPKYKTELCRTFHTTGFCPYGPRCHFIHNDNQRNHMGSVASMLSGHMSFPSGHTGTNSTSVRELDVCSSSIGSSGDISPRSSSLSGSPVCSTSYMEDPTSAMTSIKPRTPTTTPPAMLSGAAFFSGQDSIPQSRRSTLSTSVELFDRILFMQQQENSAPRAASPMHLLNAQLNAMSIDNPGSGLEANRNRNYRLPIFNQLAFAGAH